MVTMKDLMKLVNEVIEDFNSMKIRYRTVRNWNVGTKMGSRWGLCKYNGDGTFDIDISEKILQEYIEDQQTKNTIAHELLHTVEGCCNHKWYWQKLANIVNTRMPQYHITRTASPEERGVPVKYRYFFQCDKCGNILKYQKKCKFLDDYQKYHCGRCGGKFEKIDPPQE